MIGPTYATRERVKDMLDVAETSRTNGQIDRALATATEAVDGLLRRGRFGFSLLDQTRYYDWPVLDSGGAWALWLTDGWAISLTNVVGGGQAISSSNWYLSSPDNDGPPYTQLQLLRSTNATFAGGSTPQRQIALTGTWGCRDDRDTAGTLAGSINAATTALSLSEGDVAGVGDLLIVDSERMVATGRSWVASGQTLAADLASSNATTGLSVSGSASAFFPGEELVIGTETLAVVDIVGSTVVTKRAVEGSVLAAHTSGDAIYANRGYVVSRGTMGTTAASHSSGATVQVHRPPSLVAELCAAEAVATLLSGKSGYARLMRATTDGSSLGASVGAGLNDLREAALARWGVQIKVGAV